MKRLSLFLGVALLTFVTGVVIAWCYLQFPQFFSTPAGSAATAASPVTKLSGEVQIKPQLIKRHEYGSVVKFHIVNGSPETLYYVGYSKDSHCSYKIKRGSQVEQKKERCWCGTGLAERTLSPGESATYRLDVAGQSERFEVGFDFTTGLMRRKQTIWSDEVVISNP